MIEMFAIQHLPTGNYLPNPPGRAGRGGSHMEPVEPGPVSVPRLFHTETAAKIALSHWLKGKVTVIHTQTYDDYIEHWDVEATPHRKREDMLVVPVHLYLPE